MHTHAHTHTHTHTHTHAHTHIHTHVHTHTHAHTHTHTPVFCSLIPVRECDDRTSAFAYTNTIDHTLTHCAGGHPQTMYVLLTSQYPHI